MIDIFVVDEFKDDVDIILLEKAALQTLLHEGKIEEYELSIVIDTDDKLKELNNQFLGKDTPTDVLSFPADEFDPDTELSYLGDIIISFPTAQAQAVAAGVSTAAELQLLVVHGMLHILGHDHSTSGEKARMWAAQDAVLKTIGVKIDRLPE
jgi:probable rRNA maturation factor